MAGVPAQSVDQGWAWMVLLSAFLVNIISLGVLFSSGMFLVVFLDEWHEDLSSTTWIPTLATGVTFLSGPLVSYLINKFGFRIVLISGSLLSSSGFIWSTVVDSIYGLYGTFGILIGFGCGLCYLPGITMAGFYFKDKKYFAMAFSAAGTGLTSFLFPPLQDYLIETYGYRGALLLNAGITLQMAVCGAVARPVPKAKTTINRTKPSSSQSELFKDIYFYVSAFHIFFLHGYFIFIIFLNKFLIDRDLLLRYTAYISALFGIGNFIGRILVSVLGLSKEFRKTGSIIVVNVTTFAQGIAFICFIIPGHTFISYSILAVFAGITFGSKVALIFPIIAELFNIKFLNAVFGYTLFSSGLALISGPYLASWVTEKTTNVGSALILSGVFILISGFLTIWLTYGLYHRKAEQLHNQRNTMEEIALK